MAGCRVLDRLALATLLASVLAGCSGAAAEPTLEQVRNAAERYRDVRVAIAEGYTTDNKCVTAEMLGYPAAQGAMGLHYVRRDLLGLPDAPEGRVSGSGTYTDFGKPAMLVYEPQADGSMQLVAVENLVFKRAWEAAGNREPPSFRGNPYLLLADDPATPLDEAHNYEPHYELHAWVFRDNPLGAFHPFNPNVTCRHHKPQEAVAHLQPKAIPAIGPAAARAFVGSGAVLVDVREPEELRESGSLEGSVNLPLSRLAQVGRSLPADRPLLLYCRSGRRSAMAGDILTAMGFDEVYNLGSFEAAVRAGWPIMGR
jgi:rhodanese-related sulfurtransferase